jgi:glycosyltransferase involved in cell wall biosynthesis
MDTPLVSVVMPIFNGLPYLIESVASVTNQGYPSIELVLVDGGSIDGSREWVEAFEHPRVVKDYLPQGTPAAGTWTRASELASGEFVKLLCQDDLIYPDALAKQVADLQANPSAGMAIVQRDMVSASCRVLFHGRGCAGLPGGLVDGVHSLEIGARQGANIFGEPLAVLFRRDAMQAALPWDDKHPFLLDMFFYAKVLRRHDLVVRKESLGAFRISTSSWSTRLAGKQREQFRAWQEHVERDIAPQPWFRIAQARINNEKTTWLRRAAYAWLRRRGDLSVS